MTEEKIPDTIEQTLKKYIEIQEEEQRLKERKHILQDDLKEYMRSINSQVWLPEINGEKLKIRYRSVAHIEYDEGLLQERLGDRYEVVLAPDLKKIRGNLPLLSTALKPLMDRIGSPSPEKVRESIERGVFSIEDFTGTFKKTAKEYISVSREKRSDIESPAE